MIKILFQTKIYNQIFNTEDKLIETNKFHTGNVYRFFPIFSLSFESPFKLKANKYNLTYVPQAQIVASSGNSNSNKHTTILEF